MTLTLVFDSGQFINNTYLMCIKIVAEMNKIKISYILQGWNWKSEEISWKGQHYHHGNNEE